MNKATIISLAFLGIIVLAGGIFWFISSRDNLSKPLPIETQTTPETRPVSGDTGPADSTQSIDRDLNAIDLGTDLESDFQAIEGDVNSL